MDNNRNNSEKEHRNAGTFLVKFNADQNETWRGNVLWAEGNKTEHFRSALELINMIDEVMKGNVEANADDSGFLSKVSNG